MDLGKGVGACPQNAAKSATMVLPMSTLIICPVCDTHYEIAAAFPPEGRKVRCTKCTHVCRAVPVGPAAQAAMQPQPSPAPQAPQMQPAPPAPPAPWEEPGP